MEQSKTKQVLKIVIPILSLVLVLGISYALWLVTRTQENPNLVDTLECLNITLTDETNAINLTNEYAIPNALGMQKDPYTFKVTNTCDTPVLVDITLEVLSGSTIAHKHVRASVNDFGDTTDNSKILTGYSTASATISGATSYRVNIGNRINGKKSKTYDLRVWIDEATTAEEGMNKTFQSKIVIIASPAEVVPYCDTADMNLLADNILCNGTTPEAIEAKGDPDYAAVATSADTGLYAAEDEYGTSYYFRGLKTELNNNLIFAGFQWKIVRINGDGSIRIIYNGVCPDNNCTINDLHANTVAGATSIVNSGTDYTHAWNPAPHYNDNKYVGYMYGGANGSASTSRVTDKLLGNYNQSSNAVYNETSANAKIQLESWYANNIATQGPNITSKITDNLFCNDRQLQSEIGGAATGTGIGSSVTYYAARYRLYTNKTPILKCGLQNDRFTANDITVGNGALEYPVGLITADEASMAGITPSSSTANYLYTNQTYWTFSPSSFLSGSACVWYVNSAGSLLGNYVYNAHGLRPIISLESGTTISGEGSASNPYKVL